jgi:hypothetical protein
MTRSVNFQALLSAMLLMVGCRKSDDVFYLDNNFPDSKPLKYAANILSTGNKYFQNITMTSDGREQLFTETTLNDWNYTGIVRFRRLQDNDLAFDTLKIVKEFKFINTHFIGEPQISLDDMALVFVADYPTNIWLSRREETGDWGTPLKLNEEINSPADEFYPNIASDGTLFFMSKRTGEARIYKSELENGQYRSAHKVQATFNNDDAGDHFFSREMGYIVFSADRDGGYGQADLYVSFKKDDGGWSKAYNLGPEINTEAFELGPYISPDGKYLFFTRREKWKNSAYSDIYWVSLNVVSQLKNKLEDSGVRPN